MDINKAVGDLIDNVGELFVGITSISQIVIGGAVDT